MEITINDIKENFIEQELKKTLRDNKSNLKFPNGMQLDHVENIKILTPLRDNLNEFSSLGRFIGNDGSSVMFRFSGIFDVKFNGNILNVLIDERFLRINDI